MLCPNDGTRVPCGPLCSWFEDCPSARIPAPMRYLDSATVPRVARRSARLVKRSGPRHSAHSAHSVLDWHTLAALAVALLCYALVIRALLL
jgi:hypothetical protein